MWVESIKNLPEDVVIRCRCALSFSVIVHCHCHHASSAGADPHQLPKTFNCKGGDDKRNSPPQNTKGNERQQRLVQTNVNQSTEHVGLNDTNVLMSKLLPFVSCVHNTNVPLHPPLLMLMPTAVSTFVTAILLTSHCIICSDIYEYIKLNDAKMLLSKFLSDIIGFCILNLNPDDITWSKTNANRPTAQEDHSEMRLNDHSEMRLNSKMNANNFTTKESLPSSATSGPNDMVFLAGLK
ncbi:uncharacterized protein LACBIDRAFT_326558 [Laccaria bicolor S238N-H82]|uniref:Predicted protein n=1 Tax=Laccaria bicolor (strain S238N-H82 / ATCC MYA-4686) TaxID=486041 RepID=B0D910_LACBS|nr:uncharacterized protein LACBIDRAFT_326558 [Laccaria bicolor S238N-H82]EDR08929.1 predicted protein [Laccaria bicolor S238N-H82]|eukprot:XP_001880242.1 predicted protein [Laccaria bicolor S238N-H82]